jgi:hypothetical protein
MVKKIHGIDDRKRAFVKAFTPERGEKEKWTEVEIIKIL